ncbi:MAG: hypothetical protein ACD_58C00205G0004 [uncultured bacterium]|nr:MAG: hypothetical protein ACD_58C00205G0004 [uncultured bacterium]
MDSGNNNNNHAYKLAEFAVGLNTMACKDKPDNYWGSTETEKKYGTSHIAFGSNGTFGVTNDDPNRNLANVHCDMIILDPQLTIECNKKDGTKFNLIENGLPIGY